LHLRASPYIPVMNDGALRLVLVNCLNADKQESEHIYWRCAWRDSPSVPFSFLWFLPFLSAET